MAEVETSRDDAVHALVMYNLSCYYALGGRKQDTVQWLHRALRLKPEMFASVILRLADVDRVVKRDLDPASAAKELLEREDG